MKIKISTIIIGFVCMISACHKDNNNLKSNLLSGKLKKMTTTLSDTNFTFYFLYDSISGRLKTVKKNNRSYIIIHEKSGNYIQLDYDISVIDTTLPIGTKFKLRAFLDNNNYINRIAAITDTSLNTETNLVMFYANNGYPDSVRENPLGIISNSKTYGFIYQNMNPIKLVHSYHNFFSGDYIDTLSCSYTNITNNCPLPSQQVFAGSYSVGYTITGTDPLFILELDGYLAFKPNKNLLDNIVNSSFSGVTHYQYAINRGSKITNMQAVGTLSTAAFSFEYY